MTLVFILFGLFLILGMPVAFAIGIAGFVFFLQQPHLPLTMPVQLILSETQNFNLLAIPMFIFAGNLMNETGITYRLMKFAEVVTGHMYGGMAQVSVVLSTMMGGVTGSSIADASMEARILGPTMNEKGYDRGYSAAVHGFSSLITIAIPPGIGLVLYGSIGEVSVGRLFAGGLVPGLIMALFFGITVAITARKKGYQPEREKRASLKEVLPVFAHSLWAILFPILLILGLRTGWMVPSEAGAFAAVYALIVGLIAYRELKWENFKRCVQASIADIGMIMFLIALSVLVSYGLKWEMIPQQLTQALLGISSNPYVIFTIILFFLLVLGMFIDSTVIILLLTSILVPIARQLGLDLVYFGVVMVITCATGLLTPPVGLTIYAVCSVMECSIADFMREGWPFLIALLMAIALIVLFPQLILFLPNLTFGT